MKFSFKGYFLKISLLLFVSVGIALSQVDRDVVRHQKDAKGEFLIGGAFLFLGMASGAGLEGAGYSERVRVFSGVLFGVPALYFFARAWKDQRWVSIKVGRSF